MAEMSEEQAEEILRQYSQSSANMHTFFTNVVKSSDTTKTGNLANEEIGLPKVPVRTYKELALFSKDIINDNRWADYFDKMSEIQTSTSLSKEGFLMRLQVTTKKELADVSPKEKKENKGWFKKKDSGGSEDS